MLYTGSYISQIQFVYASLTGMNDLVAGYPLCFFPLFTTEMIGYISLNKGLQGFYLHNSTSHIFGTIHTNMEVEYCMDPLSQ